MSDPIIPFIPPAPATLPDQTVLDEFWRRGLLTRFSIDTLVGAIESRGYAVTMRDARPKHTSTVLRHVSEWHPHGYFSPGQIAQELHEMHPEQYTSKDGGPLSVDAAIRWLVENGHFVKKAPSLIAINDKAV